MPIVKCAGRAVSYTESGEGPPIVLLPPGASSASAWKRVVEAIGSNYRIIAVNPAGYGETEPVDGPTALTVDDEAAAVFAIISGIPDKVHLVGHSYGGVIALQAALSEPERFRSLTLLEPATYAILAEAGAPDLAKTVEAVNFAFIHDVRAGNRETALADYIDFYNGKSGAWAAMGEKAQGKLLAVADNVVAGLSASHSNRFTLADYAAITLPTRIASGAQTDPIHAFLAEAIANSISKASHQIMPNAGHMLSLTHPTETAGIILDHVTSLD